MAFDVAKAYNEKRKKEEEKKNSTSSSTPFDVAEAYKQRKYYDSLDVSGVNDEYINTFISDTNNFFKSAEETYKGIEWNNASSIYDSTNTTWQDLKKRKDVLDAWLYKNKSNLTEEGYKSLSESLNSIDSGVTSLLGDLESKKNFYGQFETEDSYKQWKAKEDEKQAILNAEDFKEYSQKGLEIENPDPYLWEWAGWVNANADPANVATFAREFSKKYENSDVSADYNPLRPTKFRDYYYLNDDEVAIYSYYLGKGETEKAEQYLASLEDTLHQREGGKIVEELDDSDPFLKAAFSTVVGLDQWASGVKNLDNFFLGTEGDTTSAIQYAGGMIREDIDSKFWRGAWDLSVTMSNQFPHILVGAVTGSVGGLATMGASVAGNSYAEMRKLGYNEWESRGYAALVTASEVGLQSVLGGIGSLGGSKSLSKMAVNALDSIDNGIARVALKLGSKMFFEGVEESAQEVLEPMFKSIFSKKWEGINWGEAAYAGLLGALSAGILESVGTIATDVNATKVGNAMQDAGEVNRLVELGKTFSADTVANQIAGKVNENTGAYTIGRLFQEVNATLSEQNVSEIVAGLEARGVPSKYAKKLAKQYQAFLNNEMELTDEQRAIFENCDPLTEAIREKLISDNLTSYQMLQESVVGRDSDAYKRTMAYADVVDIIENGSMTSTSKGTGLSVYSNDGFAQALEQGVSSSESETAENTAKESEFSHSIDGKTVLISTGEEVSIEGISTIKDGQVYVRLDNGKEVNAKDISFGTEEEALMVEMVADLGVSRETAKAMMDAYTKGKDTISAEDFRVDAPLAYKYGKIEYTRGLANLKLTEDQKTTLFGRGRTDAQTERDSSKANVQARVESAKNAQTTETKKQSRILSEDGTALDIKALKKSAKKATQKEGIEVIEFLSSIMAGDYYVFESYVNKQGERVYKDSNGDEVYAPNGYFRAGDGSIHIDLNAGEGGVGIILNKLAHEQGHYINEVNPEGFKRLADFIVKFYEDKGVDVDELVEERMKLKHSRGRDKGMSEVKAYDAAFEDVICDGLETVYHDGKVVEMIDSLKTTKEGRNVIQQLFDKLKALIKRIAKAYKGVGGETLAGQKVAKMSLEQMRGLQKIFAEALVEADETYSSLNAKEESTSNEEVQFSDRTEVEVSETEWTRLKEEYNTAWNSAQEAKKKLDSIGKNPRQNEIIDIISDKNASNEAIHEALEAQRKWEQESGYSKAYEEYNSLYDKARGLRSETGRMEERLSKALREKKYSEEEVHTIVQKAVRKYRTTSRIDRASYLLTTGSMLDFSDGQGYRVKDHREISEILNLPDYAQYSDGMIIFMNMGNIRLQTYGIDIASMPNDRQISALRGIISEVMREYDEFTVDFSKPNGNSDGSVTYPKGVASARIISDIKNYFETGNVPEYNDSLSQFRYSDRDSNGNQLTAEQQEFFKDSKVRDENGNLLVVYHGTRKADFTEFKRNINFFTDSSEMADSYAPSSEKYIGYLNIKNPFVIDAKGERWSRIPIDEKVKSLLEKYGASTFKEKGKWRTSPADIASAIESGIDEGELDYDGIIIKNVDDTGRYWKTRDNIVANDYITFKSNQFKNIDNQDPTTNPDIRYSDRVTDKETLAFLENQEHVTVYRAMQLIDGKLYPPMNAYTKDENGNRVLVTPSEIGTWEQSVERPDLIDPKTGKFKLDKGKVDGGKKGTVVPAAYNPYIHTSLSMLNDQFTSAYTRSNLVVVKGVVPKSELTSGYKAQYAKDSVGETEWHSGVVSTQLPESRKVILSRWFKPVEIMDNDDVAKNIKKMLGNTGIEIPYNVVSPKLRRSLEKIGVPIGEGRGIKNLPSKDQVLYSDRDFASQVDAVLSGADTSNSHLKVMNTPALLQQAGLPNLPILMTAKHLKSITSTEGKGKANYHGLDLEIVKKLPEYISNPVMVADSFTRNDSVVIITEVVDSENRPVIAAIMLNGEGRLGEKHIKANIMTSAYGRSNFQSFLNRIADENAVIYWNKKKSQDLSVSLGIQFPNAVTSLNSDTIIRKAKAFVNSFSENSEKFSDRDPELAAQREKINKVLETENEKLKEDNQYLKELVRLQRKVTHGTKFTKSSVDMVAGRLMKYAHAKGNKAELASILNEFYEFIAKGETLAWESVAEKAQPAIEWLKDHIVISTELDANAREALNTIRSKRIYLDEQQQAEAAYVYGSFYEYRKRAMGSLTIVSKNNTKGAISLDSQWQEFAAMYPDYFDADITTNDMPMKLLEIVDALRNSNSNEYEYSDDMVDQDLLNQVYDGYWDVSTLHTAADSMQKEITMLKNKHRRKMLEVREFHTEKHNQLKEEYQAKIARIRQDYRDRIEKKTRDLMTHYQNQRREAVNKVKETREKNDAKERLQQLVLETAKWISYPKKGDVKCPDILRKPYAEFLESIDLSSKRSFEGGEPTYNDLRVSVAMSSLATAIEQIKVSQDPSVTTDNILDSGYLDLPVNFVEKLREKAENAKNLMVDGDYVVNQMTSQEIRDLCVLIRILNHSIKEMSTLYSNLRFAKVEELGDNSITFLDSMGKTDGTNAVADFVGWDNALPYYAFKRFGEGGESVFEELMDAQDKLAFNAARIFNFKENNWTDKEAKAWGEDTHTITLTNDKSVVLTSAQAMGIYCLSRRGQAVPHLLGGGIRVIGIKKGANKASDSHTTLSQEDIDIIVKSLTERQKKVAETIQEFMSTVCADWGNEISMKRFLTNEFTEPFYYPIESNDENLPQKDPQAQQSDLYRLLNISATKPTIKGANNEVIIRNIFDVFTNHASDMARLNAYGMALLDYMKWLNYREKIIKPDGVSFDVRGVVKSMGNTYGDKARSYVLNLIKDINGRSIDGKDHPWLMKMTRMAKTAAVGFNLRVMMLQVTAYPRAATMLSVSSLAKGLTKMPNIRKAKKYCGIALWKSFGFYDTNIARSIEDQIKGTKNVRQKLIELSLKGAEWADAITWGALWNSCEYEVAKTTRHEVGSEEFNQEVAKKLREVVYATQVVDSTLTRTELMRNKSGATQMATAFMSEPSVTANVLMNAGFQFHKEKRISGSAKTAWNKTGKFIGKTIAVYSSVALATALIESFADAYRDDDDEEFAKKLRGAFAENSISNLIPINKIPILADISDLIFSLFGIGYFSSDNMALTQLSDVKKALEAWVEIIGEKTGGEDTSKTVYNALYKTVKALSSMTGISWNGLMREVVTLWNNTAGVYDPTLKLSNYERNNEELGQLLYDSIVNGEDDSVKQNIMAQFKDQDAATQALRRVVKKHYLSEELDYDTAIEYLIDYCGMDGNDAYWKMQEWDYEMTNGDSEGYTKYDDFFTAVESGKNIKDVIKEYTDNGVEKTTLAAQITSHFKPLYKEMSNYERASIKGYLLNAYALLGYDRTKKSKDIDNWLKD